MTKLHFYRITPIEPTWSADGDLDGPMGQEFEATITKGSVRAGLVYEVRQGTHVSGERYNCLRGAPNPAKFAMAFESDVATHATLSTAVSVREALQAAQKVVTIQIAPEDLKILKAADYRLCCAKKIAEGDFNVVWQSYTKYLVTNTFSWTPQYQLFGTNIFVDNITVQVATNLVTIGLGEISTLDTAGVLSEASTGGKPTAINLLNDYGNIHPGINQLSTGIDGSQVSTPIYVAPKDMVSGTASMTPVEVVQVWFEQNIETSTMFSDARSKSVTIDLTFANAQTRLYKDGKWSTPSS